MYLFVLIIFLYSFIMRIILFIIFFILSFPITTFSWEKVPVPDYVNKKTKSPWNFYDDFEDQKVGKVNLKRYQINDKGAGRKPFKIKQESNGNKFIEISVEHGWNKCCGKWVKTERAEIEVRPKRTLNKEIWYGFRLRFPKNFIFVNDRLLVSQFKNQFKNMKKSPLLHINFYENGKVIDVGGDTGGKATTKYNKPEAIIHRVANKFRDKNGKFELYRFKVREQPYLSSWNLSSTDTSYPKSFKGIKLGEWNVFKIGIKNSKSEDGFMKVFINEEKVLDYSGITFDWKGTYTGSHIRVGPYRDSDPDGDGYPRQSIHYDDFIVVSDKKTIDKYLN